MEQINEHILKDKKETIMVNPYAVWEKFYFSIEDGLSKTIRDSVNTQVFANRIDFILNSYLQQLKFQKGVVETLMEESPFSSKRDVARVAELIVALENKIDGLENELSEKLLEIEEDTDLLANHSVSPLQDSFHDEIAEFIKAAIATMQGMGQRLDSLEGFVLQFDKKVDLIISKQLEIEAQSKTKNTVSGKKNKPPKTE